MRKKKHSYTDLAGSYPDTRGSKVQRNPHPPPPIQQTNCLPLFKKRNTPSDRKTPPNKPPSPPSPPAFGRRLGGLCSQVDVVQLRDRAAHTLLRRSDSGVVEAKRGEERGRSGRSSATGVGNAWSLKNRPPNLSSSWRFQNMDVFTSPNQFLCTKKLSCP